MIFYNFHYHLSQQKRYNRLRLVSHDEAPSLVIDWFDKFKRGRTNLTKDPREGRPIAAIENNISAVWLMVKSDLPPDSDKLRHWKTINSDLYCQELMRLEQEVEKKPVAGEHQERTIKTTCRRYEGRLISSRPKVLSDDSLFHNYYHNCDTSSESSNLSNIEHRAVIKYFVKKGKTPKQIFEDMVSVLQESAPSYTKVKKWARLFQQGRESCEDDPRPGRPVTVVTEENVRKIEKLVLADRRIKLWQIAEELQISKERVGEIIHEHMNMRKISARWVPKILTPFDKQRRLQTRVHAMDEKRRKAAEEIQGSKVDNEAYGVNFLG
ncbi:Putative uncharacterized protein FLJ37770 [Eumeta japonica]|uniref:Mos1 transposase HTH domain-containing protein n=1 Tax=Eumeta variegata TaxID=151549 RepID=A0A4C1UAD7_EUMVA|nr:Putative uncharacterized protein FLJ37770 [Eumeta japonica]